MRREFDSPHPDIMSTNIILGIFSVALVVLNYVPYYSDILRNKTKPHSFTWLIWSLISGIGFFAQIADNAGPGAWVTGIASAACFGIFLLSLRKGERDIAFIDYVSLLFAGCALVAWSLTDEPLYASILVTITDLIAVIPTARKSFYKPYEETAISYLVAGFQFIIALTALNNFSLTTALYPAFLIFANWGMYVLLIARRRVISAPKGF